MALIGRERTGLHALSPEEIEKGNLRMHGSQILQRGATIDESLQQPEME